MNKKKILIADDENEFLDLIKIVLEGKGFQVYTARDGVEVIQVFKREKPDVVLLDINMPQANGIDALKTIRGYDKTLPVFMLTAFSDSEWIESAKTFGASGFIVKTDELQNGIDQIMHALEFRDKMRK